MLSIRVSLVVTYLLLGLVLLGQLPQTSLHMIEYVELSHAIKEKEVIKIKGLESFKYCNQPQFIGNDLVLISASKDGVNTDLIELNLNENTWSYFTRTNRSNEYSPTLTPSGKRISIIKTLEDNQVLWSYPLDRSNGGEALLKSNDIGYHSWLDEENVALFRVSEPSILSIAEVSQHNLKDVINGIGRCLKTDDSGLLYFVHKIADDFWYLKTYDFKSNKIKIVSEIDVEDFEILPSGTIVKASGGKLYKMSEKDQNWVMWLDLSEYGLKNITRIAAYRNKLMLVEKHED